MEKGFISDEDSDDEKANETSGDEVKEDFGDEAQEDSDDEVKEDFDDEAQEDPDDEVQEVSYDKENQESPVGGLAQFAFMNQEERQTVLSYSFTSEFMERAQQLMRERVSELERQKLPYWHVEERSVGSYYSLIFYSTYLILFQHATKRKLQQNISEETGLRIPCNPE